MSSCLSSWTRRHWLALVDDTIAELGATSPREMGKVMSTVMAKAGAQVDGKLASRLVKERLSA